MARRIKTLTLVDSLDKSKGRKIHADHLDLARRYDLRVCSADTKTPQQIYEGVSGVEVLATLDSYHTREAQAYVKPSGRIQQWR